MEDEVEYEKRRSKRNRKRCIVVFSIFLVLLLIIAIILVVTLVIVPLFQEQKEIGSFRLPTTVIPEEYVLEIQPYLSLGNFTFDGTVNITVTCRTSTDNITLHSSGLTIKEVIVKDAKSSIVSVKKTEVIPKYELLVIHLKKKIHPDETYQVQFIFGGVMGTSEGLYWRSYDGVDKFIAATKFKPTYARRVFPCFDEPEYKAIFRITIIRENGYLSLSSGGEKKTKPRENGWEADIYSASEKLPTYLVAFYIGDARSNRISKTNVSVIASFPSIRESEYALAAAQNAFEFYSSKLKFPLPLPKIDLVAIPSETHIDNVKSNMLDAMGQESTSWRLIMFDESSMLTEPQDDEWKRQEVAMKVAHEIAHQLFGNLVTPKWWDDLWLSESISTYLDIQAVNETNPTWQTLKALKQDSSYIEFDCSKSSQPMSMPVNDQSDIAKSFNLALYKKGARLMHMVHWLLKDELFWQGLSKFLKARAFNVSDYDDLWWYLTEVQKNGKNKIDFKVVMKSWIYSSGHPIVTLTRNYSQGTALVSQMSCLNESTIWEIPITRLENKTLNGDTPDIFWLNSTNKTLHDMPGKNDWVLLNGHLNAFFHVNYDKENWKMLAEQLEYGYEKIPPSTRYQLLYDALLLAKMNIISYEFLLDLLDYMRHETDLNVKEFLADVKLSEMWKMLRMSDIDSKWKHYVKPLTTSTYRELFKTKSDSQDIMSRIYLKREIATLACYYDTRECVDDAMKKSKKWLANDESVEKITLLDQYLRRPYLCTAVRNKNSVADDVYNYFKDKSKVDDNVMNEAIFEDMIYALGCSDARYRSPIYMKEFILEKGDPATFIESMLNSYNGSFHLFDFLKNNINQFKNKDDRLELVVKRLSEAIANPLELKKMEDVFEAFKKEMDKGNSRTEANRINKMFQKYEEKAAKRLEFVKYQLPSMVKWLQKNILNR